MKLTREKIRKNFTFKIINYDCSETSKSVLGLHWHGNMEMCRMIEGCCDFTVNGNSYTAQKGDIIFVNVGEFHSIDKNHGSYKMSICTFNPAILHNIGGDIGVISPHISFDNLKKCGIENEISDAFNNLYSEISNEEKYSGILFQASLIKICGLLLRYFEKTAPKKGDISKIISFQKILEYLSENYAESITLETIAKKFNYNPVYISRLFVSNAGVNFKYYLDNIRVRKATEMLLKTDMTVSEISSVCGYDTIRTFNNVFKKVMGVAPRDIRKKS